MARTADPGGPFFFSPARHGMGLIREAGVDEFRKSRHLGPHRNPGYEITYLESGEVAWEVFPGQAPSPRALPRTRQEEPPPRAQPLRLQLVGGDLALTQSRVLHQGEYRVIRPCRLLWLVVDFAVPHAVRHTPFTAADQRSLEKIFRTAGNRVVRAAPEMGSLFRRLAALRRGFTADFAEPLLPAQLRALFAETLVWTAWSLQRHAAADRSTPIARAQELLHSRLGEPLVVSRLAAEVGLGPSRFHELFRQQTGLTPADYFNRLRVARARELLARPDLPITHLALDLGFSSSQYFANTFRKYTGVTPRDFRRSLQVATGAK